jgi:hypothetical protein
MPLYNNRFVFIDTATRWSVVIERCYDSKNAVKLETASTNVTFVKSSMQMLAGKAAIRT